MASKSAVVVAAPWAPSGEPGDTVMSLVDPVVPLLSRRKSVGYRGLQPGMSHPGNSGHNNSFVEPELCGSRNVMSHSLTELVRVPAVTVTSWTTRRGSASNAASMAEELETGPAVQIDSIVSVVSTPSPAPEYLKMVASPCTSFGDAGTVMNSNRRPQTSLSVSKLHPYLHGWPATSALAG